MTNKWVLYRRFPLSTDLSRVSAFMKGQNLPHIFTEEQGEQLLWVADAQLFSTLDDFFERYFDGDIHIEAHQRVDLFKKLDFFETIVAGPVTFMIIVLGLCGYLIGDVFKQFALFRFFSFLPFDLLIKNIELWRLFTPVFLHFSISHFFLNAAWIFILGRQLETRMGMKHYIYLFLAAGFMGNILQYLVSQSIYFGGLSGVVYGYIGFLLMASCVFHDRLITIQAGLIGFSLIALFLGFTGALDWLTRGGIANWAHLGGFLAGILYACFYYLRVNSKDSENTL